MDAVATDEARKAAAVHKIMRDTVRSLRRAAADAMQSPNVNDEERSKLKEADEMLAESIEHLSRVIEEHDALIAPSADVPSHAVERLGYGFMTHLLFAASTIGILAFNQPGGIREIAKMRKAKESTDAHLRVLSKAGAKVVRDNAARRHKVLRKVHAQVRAENPGVNDNALAGKIAERLADESEKMPSSGRGKDQKTTMKQGSIYRLIRAGKI